MGDGDALAIGGNHFIHAARRNIDLTAFIFNNNIYGMTGGQVSPTTPYGKTATTAPFGSIENSFDVVRLSEAAGASFVARGTVYDTDKLDELAELAIRKKGFSVLEILSPCPTIYGRHNKLGGAVEMMRHQEENAVAIEEVESVADAVKAGRILTGVFVDVAKPEFCDEYDKLIKKTQAK
jgi:2-oxoglutarate ferredoxin oxidoreductase subunit beta